MASQRRAGEFTPGTAIVLPSLRLRWHYRSRHETLLAFSNHYFYEDRLITFPNAAPHDPRLGVEFVYVSDGIYDRAKTRTNPIEARRVARTRPGTFHSLAKPFAGRCDV